jgi:glycosyltransferase involved in cell wall biosynthesis
MEKSPAVLALSYLFPNGAQPTYGIFVLNRLRAVREHCALKVIAPVQWYPFMRWLRPALWRGEAPRRETLDGIDVHHPRFAVIPRYLKWFDALSYHFAARRVARRLRREEAFDFDLVDVHWTYPDIVAGYRLARRHGRKFMVTVRGHEALYEEERSVRRRQVARYLRRADAVITLSAELREKVIGLGVAPDRVRVILNGVDLAHFHPLDRADCRRRLGLPAGRRMMLSVGRLTAGKGHQDLVGALSSLPADVDLYIVGGVNPEENFEPALRARIAALHLEGRVHLVDGAGHDALPLWYGATDLFCLATRREGCPNVVLEALACGTPAVVSGVGAVPELVIPGENGYLVAVGSAPQEWSKIIRTALERPWSREKIAHDMQRWDWSRCGEQVLEVYRSLSDGAPRPA